MYFNKSTDVAKPLKTGDESRSVMKSRSLLLIQKLNKKNNLNHDSDDEEQIRTIGTTSILPWQPKQQRRTHKPNTIS